MKKILPSVHIFTPLILQFYFIWVFLGSRKKNHLHSFIFSSSFGGHWGETFYLVCQFIDIFGDQQKGKSDISKSCYILWYAILQKNSLAFIEHCVCNSQTNLCKELYQHYRWQNRSVNKQGSKSEITEEIKPPKLESSRLLTYLENLSWNRKEEMNFPFNKSKGVDGQKSVTSSKFHLMF